MAHFTAVGKLLLSYAVSSERQLRERLGHTISPRTPHSITTIPALWKELELTRERGFATDDQESELGVNCVAVPVQLDPGLAPAGAVSVSAIAFRMPLARLVERVDEIQDIVTARGHTKTIEHRLTS